MNNPTSKTPPLPNNRHKFVKIGRSLAIVASILALLAGIFGINEIMVATSDVKMVITWRTVGFFTFASLFLLLGLQKNINLRLWEIVTANKIILAGIGLLYGANVDGAVDAVIWDGMLAVLLALGYVLIRSGTTRSYMSE